MGYGNHNPREGVQIILQDHQRLNVQVIGRLVQKDHIGRFHQDTEQVQPALLSSGKLPDHRILNTGRK